MLMYKLLIFKTFSNRKDPNIISVIYLIDIDPLFKFLLSDLHLILVYNILDLLRIIFNFVLESPKKHSKQIGVGVTTVFLFNQLRLLKLVTLILKELYFFFYLSWLARLLCCFFKASFL